MNSKQEAIRLSAKVNGIILALCAMTALTVAAPSSFTLSAPDSVWTKAHVPVFSWTASTGADQYELWVDGARIAQGITKTYQAAPQPLSGGRHLWFVKAIGAGVTVNSSDTASFNISAAPAHMWDYTDGFERGDLNDYVSDGIVISATALFRNEISRLCNPVCNHDALCVQSCV